MKDLIEQNCPQWTAEDAVRAEQFRLALKEGNTHQNLTRLVEPEEFFWGHLWDVYQLQQRNWLTDSAVDLGSGCGVPGLLDAAISGQKWFLIESEKKKAAFLEETAQALGRRDVRVFADRAEKVLPRIQSDTVVVRAVGPLTRIWGWIGNCSTWNTLILFKGPSWSTEWADFQREYPHARLEQRDYFEYASQNKGEQRARCLVKLSRA